MLVIPFAFNLGTSATSEGQIVHYVAFSKEDFTPARLLAAVSKKAVSSTSLFADQVEFQFDESVICSSVSVRVVHPELGQLSHTSSCATTFVTNFVVSLASYNCFGLLRPCLSTSTTLNVTVLNVTDANGNSLVVEINGSTTDSATASIVSAVVNPGSSVIDVYFSESVNQTGTYSFSYTGLTFLNTTFLSSTRALLYINGTLPAIVGRLTLASPSFNVDLFGVLRLMTRDLNFDSVQDAVQIVFSLPVNASFDCTSLGLQVTSRDVIVSTSALCGDISVGPSYTRSGKIFFGLDYIELAEFQSSQLNYTDAIRPVILSHYYSNLTTIAFVFSEPLVPVSLAIGGFFFSGLHVLSVSMNASEVVFTFVPRDAGTGNITTCPSFLRDYAGNSVYCSYNFSVPDSKFPTINETVSLSSPSLIFWSQIRISFNESMTSPLPANFYAHSPQDTISVFNVTKLDNFTFDLFITVVGPSHGDTTSVLFLDVSGVADSAGNVMPDVFNVSVGDRAGPTLVSSGPTGTVYVLLFSERVFGDSSDFEFLSGIEVDDISVVDRTAIISGNTTVFTLKKVTLTDEAGNVAMVVMPLKAEAPVVDIDIYPPADDLNTTVFILLVTLTCVLGAMFLLTYVVPRCQFKRSHERISSSEL